MAGFGRRDIVTSIAVAMAWPRLARGQSAAKLPAVGFLGSASLLSWRFYVASFSQRLRELGWIEGQTVTIDYRWADGHVDLYGKFVAEFAQQNVSVIVTGGSAGTAARAVTSTIPIVLAVSNDPVGDGLVASLAHPGGNITGLSALAPELAGKRLENFRQALPNLRKLAVLGNAGYNAAMEEMSELRAAALKLGLDAETIPVKTSDDIGTAVESLKGRVDALYVSPDSLTVTSSVRIAELALKAGLPTVHGVREFVEDGGLMSYGPSLRDLFRRAAEYVDRILKGANPGDLPIEQPTKFELVFNLKTARTLGLAIPDSLLARADEVIE